MDSLPKNTIFHTSDSHEACDILKVCFPTPVKITYNENLYQPMLKKFLHKQVCYIYIFLLKWLLICGIFFTTVYQATSN